MVSDARQLQILAFWNLRIFRSSLRHLLTHSKLMAATLLTFLSGYLLVGYLLFERGLKYIHRLPAVGGLLSERILYLVFFFVFVMLLLSNIAVQYGALFRARETAWLLTLPITQRVLFFWKVVESLVVSSWGFVFISAPLLAAYGTLNQATWTFYAKALLLILPLVAIPASIASWLLILLVRYATRRWLVVAAGGVLPAAAGVLLWRHFAGDTRPAETGGNIVLALNQALRHTQISVHPLMPSTWWTDALIQSVKQLHGPAAFNALVLLSNAMMVLLVTFTVAGVFFPAAWNRSSQRGARRAAWRRLRTQRATPMRRRSGGPWCMGPGLRSTVALVIKDVREFVREPAQWIQVALVFGLLLIYVLNLRNLGYDKNPFWIAVITFLNLTVCALAICTLTTRFVFPQFSMEGRRLWILGMAPFTLRKVLLQKLFLNLAVTGAAAFVLIVLSGYMLELTWDRVALFVAAILLLSFGLNSLAMSLGALFPNFQESNPAKVVSGFGGTLCLISSFLYVTLFIALLVAVTSREWMVMPGSEFGAAVPAPGAPPWGPAVLGSLGITLVFGGIPLFFAINRVKRLELLGNL